MIVPLDRDDTAHRRLLPARAWRRRPVIDPRHSDGGRSAGPTLAAIP